MLLKYSLATATCVIHINIVDDHARESTEFKEESSCSTAEPWEHIYATPAVNAIFWIVFTVPSSMFTIFWLNPNVVLLPWKDVPLSTFQDLLALPSLHLIEPEQLHLND